METTVIIKQGLKKQRLSPRKKRVAVKANRAWERPNATLRLVMTLNWGTCLYRKSPSLVKMMKKKLLQLISASRALLSPFMAWMQLTQKFRVFSSESPSPCDCGLIIQVLWGFLCSSPGRHFCSDEAYVYKFGSVLQISSGSRSSKSAGQYQVRFGSSPFSSNPKFCTMGGSSSEGQTNFHYFTVKDIRGNDVDLSICKGKALLIVNVASECGLTTSNYKEMNELYAKYKEQGLEILAFPCNQFVGQEPGDNAADCKSDMYSF